MTSPMMAFVKVNRVGGHKPSQALTQIATRSLEQQMKVVGHKTAEDFTAIDSLKATALLVPGFHEVCWLNLRMFMAIPRGRSGR